MINDIVLVDVFEFVPILTYALLQGVLRELMVSSLRKCHIGHWVNPVSGIKLIQTEYWTTHKSGWKKTKSFTNVSMEILIRGRLETSEHANETGAGLYTNFNSHMPENSQACVIKTFVASSIRFCSTSTSTWFSQNLADNLINKKWIT